MRNKNRPTPEPDAPAPRSATSGSLTSRWFSSLRPHDRKLSFTDSTSVTGFFEPPGPFHPPRQASRSSSVQSSPRKALQRPLPELTHGTPFASQTYVPPTGAPGFDGDRVWNKSHFEFDPESKVSRKGVILKGRKDITSIVLTSSLADLVSWSLPVWEVLNLDARRSDPTYPRSPDCRGHGLCCIVLTSTESHSTPSMIVVRPTSVAH